MQFCFYLVSGCLYCKSIFDLFIFVCPLRSDLSMSPSHLYFPLFNFASVNDFLHSPHKLFCLTLCISIFCVGSWYYIHKHSGMMAAVLFLLHNMFCFDFLIVAVISCHNYCLTYVIHLKIGKRYLLLGELASKAQI